MPCPFQIGESIVCIDDSFYSGGKLYNGSGTGRYTKGKIYKVIETRKLFDKAGIVADDGWNIIPSWKKFVTLQESRKMKLNILNANQLENFT